MSKKKNKKRVLAVSCLFAAFIVAGSTFAWFTSKDEVVNKLSAENKYNVVIKEQYTPETTWTPGEEVEKKVGVVNTGNIGAIVNTSISSSMTLWQYENSDTAPTKDTVDSGNYITITETEAQALQAGGKLVVKAGVTAPEDVNSKDFAPSDTGLYIFERNKSDDAGLVYKEYAGYYYISDADAGKKYVALGSITNSTGFTVTYKTLGSSKAILDTDFEYTYDSTNRVITATYYGERQSSATNTNADDDIVIKISLDNIGDTAGDDSWKWNGTTNYFYYNKVLAAGASAADFIKSVKLDNSVKKEAFAKLDYNLHVAANSSQIAEGIAGTEVADNQARAAAARANIVSPATDVTVESNGNVNWTLTMPTP